jgi:hypothetical protein
MNHDIFRAKILKVPPPVLIDSKSSPEAALLLLEVL